MVVESKQPKIEIDIITDGGIKVDIGMEIMRPIR